MSVLMQHAMKSCTNTRTKLFTQAVLRVENCKLILPQVSAHLSIIKTLRDTLWNQYSRADTLVDVPLGCNNKHLHCIIMNTVFY